MKVVVKGVFTVKDKDTGKDKRLDLGAYKGVVIGSDEGQALVKYKTAYGNFQIWVPVSQIMRWET